VVLDLDGVLWRGRTVLEPAPAAVALLRASGHDLLYVTNNSRETPATVAERLRVLDPKATPDDVVTSSMVAAQLCEPTDRVVAFGEEGVVEALRQRGCTVLDAANPGECDAVVVGLHDFDYDSVARAARLVIGGARFIAANVDPQYPTEDGVMPGNGSVVAAISVVAGVEPLVAGKPHETMVRYLLHRCVERGFGEPVAVIGDQLATDGELALALDVTFALVLTGVTTLDQAMYWARNHHETLLAHDVHAAAEALDSRATEPSR